MKKLGKITVFVTLALSLLLFSCSNPSSSEGGDNSSNNGNTNSTPDNPNGGNGSQTISYTVTFDSMGGTTVESQQVAQGEKASKPAQDPTKEGSETVTYSFGNWYSSDDNGTTLSDTAFDFDNTPINADITLYAKWLENAIPASYVVKHYKQSLTGNEYEEVVNDRQTVSSYVGELTAAFAKTYEGFTAQAITQQTITADNSVVIEIQYTRNSYTVTYEDGNSDITISVPNAATYRYGETVNISFSGIGTNDGYSFVGWNDGTNTYKSNGTTTFIMGAHNVTLIAKWLYLFTEEPRNLGNGYYLFGDFPQSEKNDSVVVDESQSITRGDNTYYLGDDGNYYSYTATFVRYNESIMKYYKVEPIKWKVLTNNYEGKLLLLADKVLTTCTYYDYITGFHTDAERGTSSNPIYRSNYKASRIRAYLNGLSYQRKSSKNGSEQTNSEFLNKGFLYTAFTETARNKIIETNVVNNARSTYSNRNTYDNNNGRNPYACDDTIDKIFLLSYQEITNSNIIGANGLDKELTPYSKTAYSNIKSWWLRSPVPHSPLSADPSVYTMDSLESVDYLGGVVPALCLND